VSVWVAALVALVATAAMTFVASSLVKGVSAMARRFRIPPSVAGASLAAVSTSAPELATTFQGLASARAGNASVEDLGMATVFGSALFNLAIIVGAVGMRGRAELDRQVVRRDGIVYAFAIGLVLVFLSGDHALSRVEAGALLASYVLYLLWLVHDVRRGRRDSTPEPVDEERSTLADVARVVLGTAAIVLVSWALVESTQVLAVRGGELLGIAPRTLTVIVAAVAIAAGSSIPDVLTSLEAARQGEASLAISNAVGSNTFDLLICLGLPYAIVGGEAVTVATVRLAIGVLVIALLVLLGLWRSAILTRTLATLLLVAYLAALGVVIAGVALGF